MLANGADLRSLGAHYDVTAVAALPNLYFRFLEYLGGLYVLEQGAVTLLVLLLDSGNHTETCGQYGESLLLGSLGKALIHIGPLIVLTVSCGAQVLSGIANALQLLEPEFCVLLFIVGGLFKNGCYLLKALFLGLYNADLKPEIEHTMALVDSALSMFNEQSTISAVNRSASIQVADTMFLKVYRRAMEISDLTHGAFDITVAPAVNAWGTIRCT